MYKGRENMFKDEFVYTFKDNEAQWRKGSNCSVFSLQPGLIVFTTFTHRP